MLGPSPLAAAPTGELRLDLSLSFSLSAHIQVTYFIKSNDHVCIHMLSYTYIYIYIYVSDCVCTYTQAPKSFQVSLLSLGILACFGGTVDTVSTSRLCCYCNAMTTAAVLR